MEEKPKENDDYTVFTSTNIDNTHFLIYSNNNLYWKNSNTDTKKLVILSLENTNNYPLNKLLNTSYFELLRISQQDTTSASQEHIETPRIPQDVINNKIKVVKEKLLLIEEENMRLASELKEQPIPTGGGKKTTYRLNGEKVVLLHKNKKVQRSIYVKGNGKTKYCKIDHQYILLSKLKNKIQ